LTFNSSHKATIYGENLVAMAELAVK